MKVVSRCHGMSFIFITFVFVFVQSSPVLSWSSTLVLFTVFCPLILLVTISIPFRIHPSIHPPRGAQNTRKSIHHQKTLPYSSMVARLKKSICTVPIHPPTQIHLISSHQLWKYFHHSTLVMQFRQFIFSLCMYSVIQSCNVKGLKKTPWNGGIPTHLS